MEKEYNYGTVTEAINEFRKLGFTLDFNLDENCIECANTKLDVDDFEIVGFYRYEGNSDPADEAVVYAIECKNGLKGILVTAYGMYTSGMSERLLRKLSFKHNT